MEDNLSERGNVIEKIVAFPKFRPGNKHEEQTDFKTEKDRCNRKESSHLLRGRLCFFPFLDLTDTGSLTA